jgi:hypothetical protein
MQGKISMDLTFCNSEEKFSFDELVMKVADAFEHKAIAELLKLILGLIQEVLLARIFAGRTLCPECSDGKLALNGGYNRNIRTSVGEFTLRFKRVKGAIPKSGSLRDRVNNTPPLFFCKYSTCFFLLSCYGMLKRIYTRSYGNGDGTTTRVSKGTGEAVWSGARVDCPYNTQVRARTMRMRERQAASVLLSVEVFSRFEKQDPVCEAVRGKGV